MTKPHNFIVFILFITMISCKLNKDNFDATGVFEAEEIIISSESAGKLLNVTFNEGDELKSGQEVGNVDCSGVDLQKSQVKASLNALKLKQNEASPQVQILMSQIESQKAVLATQAQQLTILEREHSRISNLVRAEAAPSKQLDDVEGQIQILKKQMEGTQSQIAVINQQIHSQKSQVGLQNRAIMSEAEPLKARLSQFDDQLGKCKIINPIDGTVLVKYATSNEVTGPGKPLYKLANLQNMTLRAYVTGSQLGEIKVNQNVKVFVDKGKNEYTEVNGIVSWISNKAEFTPKTIQTKDERANLVYATKIKVKNDGFIKIGMYGELRFKTIDK